MSAERGQGPFRDKPIGSALSAAILEADRATRRRVLVLSVQRLAFVATVFVAAMFVGALFLGRTAAIVIASVALLFVASTQALAVVGERHRRRALAAFFAGRTEVYGVHIADKPLRGRANVELHLDAETLYLVAPPELARALAEAARAAGLEVTTTDEERLLGEASRKRAQSLGDTQGLLATAPMADAAELATSLGALRERVGAPLEPAVATRVDDILHRLAVAVHAVRIEAEHNERFGKRLAKKGLADPFGLASADRFSPDVRAALAELEEALR
jgi:hypothetical protein